MLIFHVTTRELWEMALNRGIYECPSLKTQGFIHCSTYEHLLETANFHFQNAEYDELIVLHIPTRKVKNLLKWETGRDNIVFPHIYGKIPIEVVQDLGLLVRNEEGKWSFADY